MLWELCTAISKGQILAGTADYDGSEAAYIFPLLLVGELDGSANVPSQSDDELTMDCQRSVRFSGSLWIEYIHIVLGLAWVSSLTFLPCFMPKQ